ncbi:MAG: hypothetical protein IPN13_12160 [Bacteroidetes bacterium]|nr:hypothetical protein [Bacteroidota bacterium]
MKFPKSPEMKKPAVVDTYMYPNRFVIARYQVAVSPISHLTHELPKSED